jgi:hypothetical protein
MLWRFGIFQYLCLRFREKDSRTMLNSNSNCDLDKENYKSKSYIIEAAPTRCRLQSTMYVGCRRPELEY